MRYTGILLAAAFVGLILAGGCVERKLTIVTAPPDAIVWLNDEEIGTAPVSVNFNWYGDYKVRIEKPGYEILNTHQKLRRPIYDYFPFDFFAEVLWPGKIRDSYTWSFKLESAKIVPAEELIQKAQQMREDLNRESQNADGRVTGEPQLSK